MSPQPFKNNRLLHGLILWLLVLWIITAIAPFNRQDWFIENILVFLYAALLTASYQKFQFTTLSYLLFGTFISLHLVGAHYTYAEVPFGFWLQDLFHFDRNHYDRIVHFCYGFLNAYPFRDVLMRAAGVRLKWSYLLAIIGILSFSSFYELLEVAVAFIVSPELGEAYLGTQGDKWDAEKDIILAFTGAMLAMSIVWLNNHAYKGRQL